MKIIRFYYQQLVHFVLDKNHILNVNGIKCCTLGHGIVANSVIKHQFYGTNRVIHDLQQFDGWKNGEIILNKNHVKRDLNSNLVYKLVYKSDKSFNFL